MKKVVIAGSVSLQKDFKKWIKYFEDNNFFVLNYPASIKKKGDYSNIHKKFYKSITKTDILFISNEDKNEIEGYIGPSIFAEITFGVAINLVYKKKIEILLMKMPSKEIQAIDEIKLWLDLGWIKIFDENSIK